METTNVETREVRAGVAQYLASRLATQGVNAEEVVTEFEVAGNQAPLRKKPRA